MILLPFHLFPLLLLTGLASAALASAQPELRIGLIGLDTSHAVAFAKILNDPAGSEHLPGARIVAAFAGGSPDLPESASRVAGFTQSLVERYGVRLYPTIEEVAAAVDAVMILSVDGRTHLGQARRVFPAHKPVFIDKPLAASLREAREIMQLAAETHTPCFSASSLRFGAGIEAVKASDLGQLLGVFSFGPATIEPHHPDLYWYGIHATEALYRVMGVGCREVVRTNTPETDIVTGVWTDGRVGTVRGNRQGPHVYGLTAFGSKANVVEKPETSYRPLLVAVLAFDRTGIAPVSAAETLEVLTFLEAADESKRRGGTPVALDEVWRANAPAAQ